MTTDTESVPVTLRWLGGTASGTAPMSLDKYKQMIKLYESGMPITKLRRAIGARNKTVSDAIKAYKELKSGDIKSLEESHITQTTTVYSREYMYASTAVCAIVNGGVIGAKFERRQTFGNNALLPMGIILHRFRDILIKGFHPKPVVDVADVQDFLDGAESDGYLPDYYVILYSLTFDSVTRSAPSEE